MLFYYVRKLLAPNNFFFVLKITLLQRHRINLVQITLQAGDAIEHFDDHQYVFVYIVYTCEILHPNDIYDVNSPAALKLTI